MTLIDMIHKWALEATLMKSVDYLFHTDAFVDTGVEKLDRDAALAQYPAEPIASRWKWKSKNRMDK